MHPISPGLNIGKISVAKLLAMLKHPFYEDILHNL
jgi:hypothetical protein